MSDHQDYQDCHGHGVRKPGAGLWNELIATLGLVLALVLFTVAAKLLFLATAEATINFDVFVEGIKMLGISMAVTFGALSYNRLCRRTEP